MWTESSSVNSVNLVNMSDRIFFYGLLFWCALYVIVSALLARLHFTNLTNIVSLLLGSVNRI